MAKTAPHGAVFAEHNKKISAWTYNPMTIFLAHLGAPLEGKSVLDMLSTLFSTKLEPGEKKRRLEDKYDIPMTKQFREEIDLMCNLSVGIKREAYAEGMAEGMSVGKAEGRAEGKAEAELDVLKNIMDSLHLAPDQAADAMGLSDEGRLTYFKMLGL